MIIDMHLQTKEIKSSTPFWKDGALWKNKKCQYIIRRILVLSMLQWPKTRRRNLASKSLRENVKILVTSSTKSLWKDRSKKKKWLEKPQEHFLLKITRRQWLLQILFPELYSEEEHSEPYYWYKRKTQRSYLQWNH